MILIYRPCSGKWLSQIGALPLPGIYFIDKYPNSVLVIALLD